MMQINATIRQLDDAELDTVSGGLQDGYHYCNPGPAGEGVYPSYVNCEGAGNPYVDAFLKGVQIGLHKGGK